jgi:beta-galactosidase
MWSIGNEVPSQWKEEGVKMAGWLQGLCHREDPTRPVTCGMDQYNSVVLNGFAELLDIVGFNYKVDRYIPAYQILPQRIILGSETASTVSSRGVYHFPVIITKTPFHEDYQTSSYDTEAPFWAQIPDEEFEVLDRNRNYFGEFVWTGFDYLGEPTPYNPGTPARSSYFGIIDLAGLKKDRYYQYQSRWNKTKKVLHVFPHWNWEEDRLGRNVPIHCYTNYDKVELFVNGKSMGVKTKIANSENPLERNRMMWNDVIYQPGEIKVVAYDKDGKKAEEKTIKTAGKPFTTKITPDRTDIIACPKELVFLEIDVVDKDGNICPRASRFMFVKVKGAGKLRALCNGDPTDHTPFSADYMKSFSGKLVATIEPTDEAGEIEVAVYGMNLKQNIIKLKTRKPISIK